MPKKKAGKAKEPPPDTTATKRKRSDAAELAKRVEETLRIRLDGAQFHDLREFAITQGWEVSDVQLRRYQQRADELLVERRDKSRKQVIARHLAQRQALYARAVNALLVM